MKGFSNVISRTTGMLRAFLIIAGLSAVPVSGEDKFVFAAFKALGTAGVGAGGSVVHIDDLTLAYTGKVASVPEKVADTAPVIPMAFMASRALSRSGVYSSVMAAMGNFRLIVQHRHCSSQLL